MGHLCLVLQTAGLGSSWQALPVGLCQPYCPSGLRTAALGSEGQTPGLARLSLAGGKTLRDLLKYRS